MRVAEERQLTACLLRGIDQRVDPAVVHMVQMTVGQKGLDRTQRDREHIRRQCGEVTVAGDVVERDLRKLTEQDFRIPVMVAEMEDRIRAKAGYRVHHRSGESVGVGKNGDPHPTRSSCSVWTGEAVA